MRGAPLALLVLLALAGCVGSGGDPGEPLCAGRAELAKGYELTNEEVAAAFREEGWNVTRASGWSALHPAPPANASVNAWWSSGYPGHDPSLERAQVRIRVAFSGTREAVEAFDWRAYADPLFAALDERNGSPGVLAGGAMTVPTSLHVSQGSPCG